MQQPFTSGALHLKGLNLYNDALYYKMIHQINMTLKTHLYDFIQNSQVKSLIQVTGGCPICMDFVGTTHQQIYILHEYLCPKEPFKLELLEEN